MCVCVCVSLCGTTSSGRLSISSFWIALSGSIKITCQRDSVRVPFTFSTVGWTSLRLLAWCYGTTRGVSENRGA